MHYDTDILILGGGLVGTALAAALRHGPHAVLVLETQACQALPLPSGWDSRVYTLTPASCTWLRHIGAWPLLDHARVQEILCMAIFGDDRRSYLEFNALDIGAGCLAVVLEKNNLNTAFHQLLKTASRLTTRYLSGAQQLCITPEAAVIHTQDGHTCQARLLIGADGAHSWVRRQLNISQTITAYQQWGVVANFETEQDHYGAACQWFFPDGVLACLPLPGKKISMVWSCPAEQKEALLSMDEDDLCRTVAAKGGEKWGKLALLSVPRAFALQAIRVASTVQARVVLIGDAAHTIHPLAGQGVNLGLGDTAELAKLLLSTPTEQLGDVMLLKQYEARRREPVYLMQTVCHALQRLFNNTNPVLARLRNTGLSLTHRSLCLKRQLIRYAIGK